MLGLGVDITKSTFVTFGDSFVDNYSVLLDGVDEYINIDSVGTALAATTVGTISMWVKPVDSTPSANEYLWSFGDTDGDEYIVCFIKTDGTLRVELKKAGTIQFRVTTDIAAFLTGVWANITVTVDGVGMPKIYINATEVAHTDNFTTDITAWFNNLSALDNGRVGCLNFNSGGNAFNFNGNINDVLLINDTLTSGEVTTLYNAGTPKDESGITLGVSYFKIDGDVVNTATDSIGSNNGTYVNVEQADIEIDTP